MRKAALMVVAVALGSWGVLSVACAPRSQAPKTGTQAHPAPAPATSSSVNPAEARAAFQQGVDARRKLFDADELVRLNFIHGLGFADDTKSPLCTSPATPVDPTSLVVDKSFWIH